MATYTDICTKTTLTGKDIGIVFGVIHEGITPSGTPETGVLKDFVIDPATYGPFYPRESYPKDFVSTKSDVTVYDDGVKCTVSSWAPSTGTATLSAAPETGSTMTADIVEQRELYIAQNVAINTDQDEDDLYQLRNAVKRKNYGNIKFNLKADFKVADLETMKLIFEETATDGIYEFPTERPVIYCAIIIEKDEEIIGIIYCEDVKADFSDIINASAGKDPVENGFELTFGTAPILVDVEKSA